MRKSLPEAIKADSFEHRAGNEFMNHKDRLFTSEMTHPGDFVFDDRVVSVFPDMINRSVPGYGLTVPLIGLLARRYAQSDSNVYDLGCSLGAVSLAMRTAIRAEGVKIMAVDNSPAMVRQLEENLSHDRNEGLVPVYPIHQNILETRIERASVVVLNFTLQFIDPEGRQGLLTGIHEGLNPGGILILSEKIRFEDPVEQGLQDSWHREFKRAQGYSDLEIARKRDALEHVMRPDSLTQHYERLKEVGFETVVQWFQGLNFVSLVAFA
jgi:tRNA (cmo5U34)-methyltransferase